jgi:hypothetical protein
MPALSREEVPPWNSLKPPAPKFRELTTSGNDCRQGGRKGWDWRAILQPVQSPELRAPVNDIANGAFGNVSYTVSTPTSILGSFLGGDASPG